MPQPDRPDEEYLTSAQVATLAGVTESAVRTWRQRGVGPPIADTPGHTVLYRRADVEAWLATWDKRSKRKNLYKLLYNYPRTRRT